MDLGVHLPLMRFGGEPLSLERLARVVDTARECGFAAVAANDHFVYQTDWLDGPTALASMIERSGRLALATTVSLPVLRGPVPLAKALAAIDVLSEGRLVAAVGPGSSSRDYDAVGVAFEERWARFDEALAVLRGLLGGGPVPGDARFYIPPSDIELAPGLHQRGDGSLWVASWGSNAGLARVARSGDGWLASAYNTTPDRFAAARGRLARALEDRGRDADRFPNALATMWSSNDDRRHTAERAVDWQEPTRPRPRGRRPARPRLQGRGDQRLHRRHRPVRREQDRPGRVRRPSPAGPQD